MCRLVCRRDRRLRFLLVCFLNFARAGPPPGGRAAAGRAEPGRHPRRQGGGRAVSLSVLVPKHHKWKVSIFLPGSFIGWLQAAHGRAPRSSAVQTASGPTVQAPRLPLPQFYGCGTWEVGRRGAGLGLAEAHTASSYDELEED